MNDYGYRDEADQYTSLTVTFEGKDDTIWFRPGDNPAPNIENRMTELHSTALCLWIFYVFGVLLAGSVTGHLLGSVFGILVLFVLGGLTFHRILRKSDQMFGLIEEWQAKLSGKPSPSASTPPRQERLGPPAEWID